MLARKVYLVLLCLVLVLPALALSYRFNGTATIHYKLETGKRSEYDLTLAIPVTEYRSYRERPRPVYEDGLTRNELAAEVLAAYRNIMNDSGDDYLIEAIVDAINEAALAEGFHPRERVEFALQFVQGLTYMRDTDIPLYGEYPRYPLETLFDQGGDCEDTSILLAAILTEMGFEVALLFFEDFDHMGLGIYFPGESGVKIYGNSWIDAASGKRYWYLDTSGSQHIGWAPDQYELTPAYVYPVSE